MKAMTEVYPTDKTTGQNCTAKVCLRCKQSPPTVRFHRCKAWPDGFQPYCVDCRKAQKAMYADPSFPRPTREERFWSRIDKSAGSEGCWIWRNGGGGGYGGFRLHGKQKGPHRIVYELSFGPIPDGQCVLHHCDNKKCCNPAHLFIGTNQANVDDKIAKLRQPKGQAHGMSRLGATDVVRMRWLYESGGLSYRELSRLFRVAAGHVGRICRGQSWSYLPVRPPLESAMRVAHAPRGECNRKAKLTDELVREARKTVAAGDATCASFARRHGVACSTVHNAVRRKTWRHVL